MFKRILPKKQTIALVDISSASVRGAYVHIEEGKQPTLFFTAYIPIENGSGEPSESVDPTAADMLHALTQLAERLVKEGAPVLREELGSGSVEGLFVSVGAPWQETSVRIESVRKDEPFIFTKALIDDAKRSNDEGLAGRTEASETVIGTILNGYETAQPFGKRVTRADLIILTSTLDAAVTSDIEKTLKRAFHGHPLHMTAFAPVAYDTLRDLYPLEKDFLILDVAGTATDIAMAKGNMLVDVQTVDLGVHDLLRAARSGGISGIAIGELATPDESIIDTSRNAEFANRMSEVQTAWINNLKTALVDFETRHPLPRTLFLIADGDTRDYLRRLLDSESLRSLWLSTEPLKIVPILAEQFAPLVESRASASGDAYMAMLALYYARRIMHVAAPLKESGPTATTSGA